MASAVSPWGFRGRGGSSVRRPPRRTLDPQQLQQAEELRHHRCTLRRIAKALKAPLATIGRVMNALGLGRLRNLEPRKPVQRYQWKRPGDMIHVDTKQLARFERVGHRITGDRRHGCSRGAGYEKHVAIDDATRLAYVEVLADELRATTVGFLGRAVGWFSKQGITCRRVLPDNGPAYRSGDWRKACRPWISSPSAPSPTRHAPTANRSVSSKPSWRNGLTSSPTRHQRNTIVGYPAIWRSITAGGATWLSVASALNSAFSGC